MKRYLLLFVIVFLFIGAFAQNISVKSFRALPMDMTASSLEGKRIDQNGEVAALIKVVTTEKEFSFEGGALGIVGSQTHKGEIWVWVPRGLRKITILHDKLGVLRDYMFPIEIEAERTYEMVLTTGKVETIVKEEVKQQYLVFKISPANAVLEVDGKLWEVTPDGTARNFVDFGTYNYRVQAPNYHTEAGKATVNDPEKTEIVVVNLIPDLVEVTLKVDADAEIWVNNVKKGVRTWTGSLGKGSYKMECKQVGHETSMITKEITGNSNGQVIDLPKPTPAYGSLNIESTPDFATIYIDGKEVGETPKFMKDILVGEHVIKLVKGNMEYADTITVTKGEHQLMNVTLNKGFPNAEMPLTTQEGGVITKYDRFYYYDGKQIDDVRYCELMESCPQAWAEYQRGCRKRKTGKILLISSGGFVGVCAIAGAIRGAAETGQVGVNRVLGGAVEGAIVGLIPAIISIPFSIKGKQLINNAYNTYNQYCSGRPTATLSFGPTGNGVGVSLNF